LVNPSPWLLFTSLYSLALSSITYFHYFILAESQLIISILMCYYTVGLKALAL
jgi:hypothetical protein